MEESLNTETCTDLFDAHVHLQFFNGRVLMKDGQPTPSLDQVIRDANVAGVKHFICNATCENDWQRVIDISKQYTRPNDGIHVHVALGIHPWYMHTLTPDWDKRLGALLEKNPTFMVGEIGLDKAISNMYVLTEKNTFEIQKYTRASDMWTQINVFRRQLELAHQYNRPAMVHCGQRSWDLVKDALKMQKQAGLMPPCIVSHSHHGDENLTKYLAEEYNAYFSFSPLVTWEQCKKVRTCLRYVIKNCPERLLFESDAYSNISDTPKAGVTATADATLKMAEQIGIKTITSAHQLRQIAFNNFQRILNKCQKIG